MIHVQVNTSYTCISDVKLDDKEIITCFLMYFWELILINSPIQLLWQTGSETVFGP